MQLSFKMDDSAVTKRLRIVKDGLKDVKKPLRAAGSDLMGVFGGEVFRTQGTASGASWRKLTEATLRARAGRWGHYAKAPAVRGKILWWTGALKSGFTKTVTKTKLRVYNKVKYFKFHQVRGGRPPQRKIITLNSKTINIVVRRLAQHVSGLLK